MRSSTARRSVPATTPSALQPVLGGRRGQRSSGARLARAPRSRRSRAAGWGQHSRQPPRLGMAQQLLRRRRPWWTSCWMRWLPKRLQASRSSWWAPTLAACLPRYCAKRSEGRASLPAPVWLGAEQGARLFGVGWLAGEVPGLPPLLVFGGMGLHACKPRLDVQPQPSCPLPSATQEAVLLGMLRRSMFDGIVELMTNSMPK